MAFNPSLWHFSIDKYLNPWVPRPPWRHLPQPITHFLGHRKHPQKPLGNLAMVFWAFLGVFTGIILIEVISHQIPLFRDHGAPIIVGSFGAAAVLEFYAIESPLAQPRNAVLGQLFAAIIGVAVSKLFALGTYSRELIWLGGSLSCACAVAVMALTNTVHPPAGATALLAVVDPTLSVVGWYLIPIVLLGCAIMQVVALLFNNIQRRFPTYWWTPEEVGQRWQWIKGSGESAGPEARKGSGQSDTDAESAAAARIVSVPSRLPGEGAESDHRTVVIKRGCVLLPDDMYITPEERILLEEMSERL